MNIINNRNSNDYTYLYGPKMGELMKNNIKA